MYLQSSLIQNEKKKKRKIWINNPIKI